MYGVDDQNFNDGEYNNQKTVYTDYYFKNSGCSIGTPSNPVDNKVIQQLKDSISGKVDKVAGKGLSTNDYSTAEKNKLASLPDDFEGACTDAEIEAMLKELGL